jgi:hypothetical protein
VLAKMTFKSCSSALLKSASTFFGASQNELSEMEKWFKDPDTFSIVNEARKSQAMAGNRNMFAAIAQVLMDSSCYATPTIENQRFYVILFTAAAFEAGMIDDDIQQNVRNVHHSLFSDNEEDFDTAFPIMA